ncbi:MAG: hypothetical protein CMM02_19795 [Rhodopirellula sp.]|jgi:ribosome-binding protein aMBF1 (putative translation factor)|nr:hypothetical protein [Rhodopirellula sp.]
MDKISDTRRHEKFMMPSITFQHYKRKVVVTETYQDIIAQLVVARHKQKLSQEELAYKIGCAKSLVHKWEQYKRVPSGFLLACWLDALGLKVKVHKKTIIK